MHKQLLLAKGMRLEEGVSWGGDYRKGEHETNVGDSISRMG